jgi:hypothetical protein
MSKIYMNVDATLAEVPVNVISLIDDTDFKTQEENVTYDQAGLNLVWNFVTTGGSQTQTPVTPTTVATGGGDYDWKNQGNGIYSLGIPASGGAFINNDTEGAGWFTGKATGILPWTGPIITFRASGTNDKLINTAYDIARGLAGTALPGVAADAAGGLPISDAGGLDLDTYIKRETIIWEPSIPISIQLANTATTRIALLIYNSNGAIVTTAQITAGTIYIEKMTPGETAWTTIVDNQAMVVADGLIYYDAVFSSGAGYTDGDAIRIRLLNHKVTIDGIDYEFSRSGGANMWFTYIKKSEPLSANLTQINGNTIPVTNLEDNFDGTGYFDDTAPSTQAQLNNVANVGSAVNTPASDYLLTTGNETANSYTDTAALNGTRHTHTDAAGQMDLYYEFTVGGGTPSSVTVTGALTGVNDDLEVYGYDWVASAWVQIGQLSGKVSSINEVNSYDLFVNMVGTGANLGKVRVRFTDGAFTLTTATLYIDQIFVSFSLGTGDYALGAIWVNTNASNTNTVVGVDGVSSNPVSTWAAALTLSAATNLKRFHIINGSSIALSANSDSFTLEGEEWDLALGGQSIEGLAVIGANVTGIGTATVTQPHFHKCHLGAVTLPPSQIENCGIGEASGQFTAGSAGDYIFEKCYSMIPGAGAPVYVFTGLGSTTGINNRGYTGGATYTLDSDCTLSHEVLAGGGTTVTTGGADVEIRGITTSITLTMSAAETVQFVGTTGSVTLNGTTTATVNLFGVTGDVTDNTSAATVTTRAVSIDTIWDELLSASTHNIATSAGRRLRDLASVVIITGTSPDTGGTANTSVRIELDSDASSTDGAYDPAVITIVAGTGAGQSRQIFQYDGSNKYAYVNRDWKVIPDNTSQYVISADSGNTHVNEGLCGGSTANTITLNALASTQNNIYNGQIVFIVAGTGSDQSRRVVSYVGSTQTATVDRDWDVNPGMGCVYAMLPASLVEFSTINTNLDTTVSSRSSHSAADVWTSTTRTLSSYGTLVADTATAVWAAGTRTLTSFGTLVATIWANVTRTLTAIPTGGATEAKQDTIIAKTNNLPEGIKKNTALPDFEFEMVLASDGVTAATGLTITAQRSIDGGAYASMVNSATEVGNGTYTIDLAQADTNGDNWITYKFSADTALTTTITFKVSL